MKLLDSNSNKPPDYIYSQSELNKIFDFCYKENIQVHCHSIGDYATSMVINAVKNSREKNKHLHIKNNQINYVAHLELVRKKDIESFKEFDIGANFSPFWFFETESSKNNLKIVGNEKIEGYYPVKSMTDKNIICGFGSDWPVTSVNPLDGIEVAVTHKYIGEELSPDEEIFNKPQILSIFEAINSYTIKSACLLSLDEITGSLEIGKYLDLIILDKNIFEIPKNEIHTAQVLKTYISGNLAYEC